MQIYHRIILSFFFILLVFLVINPCFLLADEDYRIVIIQSRILTPYNNALRGFTDKVSNETLKTTYTEYNLEDYVGKEQEITENIINIKPSIIFAIGTEAALFSKTNLKENPIIFSMVLDPIGTKIVESFDGPNENITGVYLKISIEDQFRKLKEVIPNLKKVGMLYDANSSTKSKEEAEDAAKKLDLILVAQGVYSKADIDKTLDDILNEVDCLWAGVDTFIYNPQSAQHIILKTLRNKIPFMAFSSNYVNAGALMTLECDYADIGAQAAEIAIKVMKGAKPESISVQAPRKMKLIINQKTAQTIGIKMPRASLE